MSGGIYPPCAAAERKGGLSRCHPVHRPPAGIAAARFTGGPQGGVCPETGHLQRDGALSKFPGGAAAGGDLVGNDRALPLPQDAGRLHRRLHQGPAPQPNDPGRRPVAGDRQRQHRQQPAVRGLSGYLHGADGADFAGFYPQHPQSAGGAGPRGGYHRHRSV